MTDNLIVYFHDGVCGSIELPSGVQECQLDDEEVLQDVPSELCNEFTRSFCGAAYKIEDQ